MRKLRLTKMRCLPKVSRPVNSRAGIWSHRFVNHKAWTVYSPPIASHPSLPTCTTRVPRAWGLGCWVCALTGAEECVLSGIPRIQTTVGPSCPVSSTSPTLSEPAAQNGGRFHCRRGKAGRAFHPQGAWKQFSEKQQSTWLRGGTLACHSSALGPGED